MQVTTLIRESHEGVVLPFGGLIINWLLHFCFTCLLGLVPFGVLNVSLV